MKLKVSLIIGVFICHISGLFFPLSVGATGSGILISGLQSASSTQASDEFVELYNSGAADVSLTGWQLQYRAATAANGTDCTKGWTTKATISSGVVAAGGHYLLSSAGYLAGSTNFAPGLASAGTVRILDAAKAPADSLAYGAASCGTGLAAPAPAAGQSLVRRAGLDGSHGNNALDFFAQMFPFVQATPPSTPSPTASQTFGSGTGMPQHLILSELLIDPVAPLTDAHDEFVELYNAGSEPVEGQDYSIQSGTHKYTLPKGTIAPGAYLVVTSADSTLSLSNSGGVANLLDNAGDVIDTAGAWGMANPGSSWAYADETWRWTITPTPGAANIYTPTPSEDTASGIDYAPVELSELLPDPAAPLTDANDEFIEIYNPTAQPVDLTGYVLKAGHDLASKAVIKGVTVPAAGYVALKSSVTKLALSNTGSSVALYTPDGVQLGLTVTYPKAGTGNAWARLNGNWDWTSEPTPGAENIISAVSVDSVAAAAKAKAAKTKALAKSAASKTKAAAKVKAAKTTKPATKPLLAGTTSAGGRWLLFILAGLTLAYIIYEFRYDIRNYYHKFRGYQVGRPSPVPVPVGRGSDRVGQRPRRG